MLPNTSNNFSFSVVFNWTTFKQYIKSLKTHMHPSFKWSNDPCGNVQVKEQQFVLRELHNVWALFFRKHMHQDEFKSIKSHCSGDSAAVLETKHTRNLAHTLKYHVIPCFHACGWWEKNYKENKPKLYSTNQFFSACFQVHIAMLLHPVCIQ